MEDLEITSYLRSHRKRAGLTQRDLANLLGYLSHNQVSKHERAETLPSLLIALGYQALFRVPIAELFPGVYGTVKLGVEERLAAIESELHQSSAKGREAHAIARRLEWLCERNSR
jgi:DNA-binding XRE family transcriptional regulator